jgi:hypothetical protein
MPTSMLRTVASFVDRIPVRALMRFRKLSFGFRNQIGNIDVCGKDVVQLFQEAEMDSQQTQRRNCDEWKDFFSPNSDVGIFWEPFCPDNVRGMFLSSPAVELSSDVEMYKIHLKECMRIFSHCSPLMKVRLRGVRSEIKSFIAPPGEKVVHHYSIMSFSRVKLDDLTEKERQKISQVWRETTPNKRFQMMASCFHVLRFGASMDRPICCPSTVGGIYQSLPKRWFDKVERARHWWIRNIVDIANSVVLMQEDIVKIRFNVQISLPSPILESHVFDLEEWQAYKKGLHQTVTNGLVDIKKRAEEDPEDIDLLAMLMDLKSYPTDRSEETEYCRIPFPAKVANGVTCGMLEGEPADWSKRVRETRARKMVAHLREYNIDFIEDLKPQKRKRG